MDGCGSRGSGHRSLSAGMRSPGGVSGSRWNGQLRVKLNRAWMRGLSARLASGATDARVGKARKGAN